MAEDAGLPSDLQMVCRNLRLLNLDRLDDWPSITINTFVSSKDQHVKLKSRIKHAEWVLYRLFELWDKKETQSKLNAYFPAYEPLQSIKLRGALLQLLMALKQNGVLAKECTLRKNMLDECRGEKFEQVLLSFSTAVVKRVALQQQGLRPSALSAAILADAPAELNDSTRKVLPLAMEASCRKVLTERANMKPYLSWLLQDFNVKQRHIDSREGQIIQSLEAHLTHLINDNVEAEQLKNQLRDNVYGSRDWVNTFISGDHHQHHNLFWDMNFDEIWVSARQGHVTASPGTVNDGLLADLGNRVKEQQTRLERWRDFQKELSRRSERSIISKSPYKSPKKMETPRMSSRSPKKASTKERTAPLPRKKLDFDQPTPNAISSPPVTDSLTNDLELSLRKLSISATTGDETPTMPRPRSISPAKSRLFQDRERALTPRSSHHAYSSSQPPTLGYPIPRESAMAPPSRPTYPQRNRSALGASELRYEDQTCASLPAAADRASPPEASSSVTSPNLSLAERTRQSMALASSATPAHRRKASVQGRQEPQRADVGQSYPTSTLEPEASSPEQNMTLTERAALSMARLQLSTHKRSQSQGHPQPSSSRQNSGQAPMYTDRFTPNASVTPQTSTAEDAEDAADIARPSTPAEQLFAADMDAESIFKPRSRLRRSPPPA